MECDNEETRATQKLYNPANIESMIEKCKSDEPMTFYEHSEKDLIKEALEFYKRKDKIMGLVTRFNERRNKLKQIVSIDIEPHYWYKEQYALDTLDYIVGKEPKRVVKREDEER